MNRLIVARPLCNHARRRCCCSPPRFSCRAHPTKQFGASITGAYEGWFDNADGTHTFLVGYYNRNTQQKLDMPIGPNNRIEPGGPDLGQPTHFLPGRHTGMFIVTVPKEFTPAAAADLDAHRQRRRPTAFRSACIPTTTSARSASLDVGNTPPVLRLFDEKVDADPGSDCVARPRPSRTTASRVDALPLPLWADDDAKYSSGTNAPMTQRAAAGRGALVEVPRSRRGHLRQRQAEARDAGGWQGERAVPR